MRIRMLKTENGSVDGIRVQLYVEGEKYDLNATDGERELAAAFVGSGMAVDLAEEPAASVVDSEQATAAPAAKPARSKK
jgi:hypothetical protein